MTLNPDILPFKYSSRSTALCGYIAFGSAKNISKQGKCEKSLQTRYQDLIKNNNINQVQRQMSASTSRKQFNYGSSLSQRNILLINLKLFGIFILRGNIPIFILEMRLITLRIHYSKFCFRFFSYFASQIIGHT